MPQVRCGEGEWRRCRRVFGVVTGCNLPFRSVACGSRRSLSPGWRKRAGGSGGPSRLAEANNTKVDNRTPRRRSGCNSLHRDSRSDAAPRPGTSPVLSVADSHSTRLTNSRTGRNSSSES